jgi:hypothetical protein
MRKSSGELRVRQRQRHDDRKSATQPAIQISIAPNCSGHGAAGSLMSVNAATCMARIAVGRIVSPPGAGELCRPVTCKLAFQHKGVNSAPGLVRNDRCHRVCATDMLRDP